MDWPSRLAFYSFWNIKSLSITTLIRIHSFYHVLSFAVTHYHFSLVAVIRCHSLWLAKPLVVSITVIHSLYDSLSFVVPLIVTHCHSLSLLIIRCRLMHHRLPFHKWALIHNLLLFTSFIIKTKNKKTKFLV